MEVQVTPICDKGELTLLILNIITVTLFLLSEYIGQSRCTATGVVDFLLSKFCGPQKKAPESPNILIV